uniref:CD8+ T-cell target antigen Tp9 n=1 Tax=Theileria parva lawrencei TaxID=1148490 RepID=H9A5L5_THEPA|nr:CD8+ T-cell target antigen Tp9 [Theileria parva lawrencei]
MNVLTTGIILYSFYQCICMDSGDDDDDVFGAAGGSMLPPRQRSPMFSGGLGSSFTSGYTRQELDAKFPGMKKGKGSKDKAPWNNPPQPPKPVKSTLIPGDDVPQGAVGPYGGGYPSQGPYGQSGAGPYGQTGYVGQPGPYPPPGATGPYGQTGYVGQPGASGGYGAGYSGQGGYPPQGYGQPGQGPYPPPGAAGGYGGGPPGPGQPSGPPGQAPGNMQLLTIDAKTKHNGANIIVDEYRAGRPERIHRQFDPVPGCGINQVNYNGQPVWKMIGEKYAVTVVLFPIGFEEKTIVITMIGGEKEIYKKKGRNKPWTKQ